MPTRRHSLLLLPALALAPHARALNLGQVLGAVQTAGGAMALSDDQVRGQSARMAAQMDAEAPIAPPAHKQARRLAALTADCREEQGLALNFKVYLTPEVNAFALADGSIRFYSGLMDMMTDDEIRYVIGHEIGHVKSGHSKKRMQTALRASAVQNAAGAAGGTVGRIASSELGDLFRKVVVAQHSQANEKEADDYSLNFMKTKGYQAMGCVTALDKLAAMEAGHKDATPWLSTHPSPAVRAKRMRTALGIA